MAAKVARWLAPLALAAVIAATYLVVHKTLAPKHAAKPVIHATTLPATTTRGRSKGRGHPGPRFYTVRPGDSLSEIAVKNRVPVSTLNSLNPNLNPNALQVGQRLKVSP